jgi:hypothetical protein
MLLLDLKVNLVQVVVMVLRVCQERKGKMKMIEKLKMIVVFVCFRTLGPNGPVGNPGRDCNVPQAGLVSLQIKYLHNIHFFYSVFLER